MPDTMSHTADMQHVPQYEEAVDAEIINRSSVLRRMNLLQKVNVAGDPNRIAFHMKEVREEDVASILEDRGVDPTSVKLFHNIINETRANIEGIYKRYESEPVAKIPHRLDDLRVAVAESEYRLQFYLDANRTSEEMEKFIAAINSDKENEKVKEYMAQKTYLVLGENGKIIKMDHEGLVMEEIEYAGDTPDPNAIRQQEFEKFLTDLLNYATPEGAEKAKEYFARMQLQQQFIATVDNTLKNAKNPEDLKEIGITGKQAAEIVNMMQVLENGTPHLEDQREALLTASAIMTYAGQEIHSLQERIGNNPHSAERKNLEMRLLVNTLLSRYAYKTHHKFSKISFKDTPSNFKSNIHSLSVYQESIQEVRMDEEKFSEMDKKRNEEIQDILKNGGSSRIEFEYKNHEEDIRGAIEKQKEMFFHPQYPNPGARNVASALKRLHQGADPNSIPHHEVQAIVSALANNKDDKNKFSEKNLQKNIKELSKTKKDNPPKPEELLENESIRHAALYEMATQAQQMIDKKITISWDEYKSAREKIGGGFSENALILNNPDIKYHVENSGSMFGKLMDYEGLGIYTLGKIGGVITVIANVVSSFNTGTVSPYIFLGMGEMYLAYDYMKGGAVGGKIEALLQKREPHYMAFRKMKQEGLLNAFMREKELLKSLTINKDSMKEMTRSVQKQKQYHSKIRTDYEELVNKGEVPPLGEEKGVVIKPEHQEIYKKARRIPTLEHGRWMDSDRPIITMAGLQEKEKNGAYNIPKLGRSVKGDYPTQANYPLHEKEKFQTENHQRYQLISILADWASFGSQKGANINGEDLVPQIENLIENNRGKLQDDLNPEDSP